MPSVYMHQDDAFLLNIVSMQTALGLKHVHLRVLRNGLKSIFLGWKDVCQKGVLNRLMGAYKILAIGVCCLHGCPIDCADFIDLCADVLENAGEDGNRGFDIALLSHVVGSEGVRDSVPFRKNRPTIVVDSDSALAIQVIKRAVRGSKMSAG